VNDVSDYKTMNLTENPSITTVVIDGTEALSGELTQQLSDAADQAEDSGTNSTLFLRLAGDANCSVEQHWPGCTDIQAVNRWERLLRRMERSDSTIVLLAERTCSALAFELLAIADYRLACHDFRVSRSVPGTDIWPSLALYRLSRQIGEVQTRKLFLTMAEVTAEECQRLNVVDEVVEGFEDAVLSVDQFLKHAPLDDFPVRRRLMQDSLSMYFDDALGLHLAACDRALRRTSDRDESAEVI
jgi:isomerase DpgB